MVSRGRHLLLEPDHAAHPLVRHADSGIGFDYVTNTFFRGYNGLILQEDPTGLGLGAQEDT